MPTISIRVSPQEREELDAAARMQGHTISDYIRDAVRIRQLDEYGNALDRLTDLELRVAKLENLAERSY